jgi:BirA family biotin operon repressor/biotin-[acetyl-CoA-carboxylase] ligase
MSTRATDTENEDNFNNYKDTLTLYCLEEPIDSTQDETKRRLLEREENDKSGCPTKALAVLASQQTSGRGTNGRTWEGQTGNVHLTIAVPMNQIPVTITLLPLQVGVLIAHGIRDFLSRQQKHNVAKQLTVKWPNDVLLDDCKIAGVLIENWLSPSDQTCWLLIGVGINVAYAPTNLPSGVRPATCLNDVYQDKSLFPEDASRHLGAALARAFIDWITVNRHGNNLSIVEAQVLKNWRSLAKFGQLYTIRETGEEVRTLDIQKDGQLKVRGADGRERLLVSDYFH